MATFYHCAKCGDEFLTHDNMPSGDEIEPICDSCGHPYQCGICNDYFYPTVHTTLEGVVFVGQTDYCPPCYARECMPIDEEMALAEGE